VKRAGQYRLYRPRAAAFLEANPACMFPLGCGLAAVDVHHVRGRQGARLLDEAWWAASCRYHNTWAEENTGEALACGWLIRIEGVA